MASVSDAAEAWDDEPAPAVHVHGAAVQVEDLWIRYRTTLERGTTLRQAVTDRRERIKTARHVEAIRGITFEVPTGGVYGVIGHNGAGKSTLFRTIAGILSPSHGRVIVTGRVTPLMTLGVGFNPELTGRENILLGGLATGLHPEEILEHYDEVVAFAELGDALDYPLKTYSSGMYARLGFAVASHLNPEILLIDEALSAGDARFKKRCADRLMDLCGQDCTVMIISHGLSLIEMMADRALWLDHGQIQMEGPGDEVVAAYMDSEDVRAAEGDDAIALDDI
jgi:ABC-type polysaccharide/polyol phosphate transport system ATPase subunit